MINRQVLSLPYRRGRMVTKSASKPLPKPPFLGEPVRVSILIALVDGRAPTAVESVCAVIITPNGDHGTRQAFEARIA